MITDILFFLTLDIDECTIPGIKCTQKCNNFDGGYKCECFSGYKLEADEFTCTGIDHYNLACKSLVLMETRQQIW